MAEDAERERAAMKEIYVLIVVLVVVIAFFSAALYYFKTRVKIEVLKHKVRLLETDLRIARDVLARHPLDALEYVSLAQEASAKVE